MACKYDENLEEKVKMQNCFYAYNDMNTIVLINIYTHVYN